MVGSLADRTFQVSAGRRVGRRGRAVVALFVGHPHDGAALRPLAGRELGASRGLRVVARGFARAWVPNLDLN